MRIAILTVPYDAGRRSVGVGLGPARLLEAGIAHELREAGHHVREATVDLAADAPPHEVARVVALQRELARQVQSAVAAEEFPLILSGNCMSAIGTLAGCDPRTAIVWFDAHGDFNTPETTMTGMLDGMALATATGQCLNALVGTVPRFMAVDEDRVALVGARDLDLLEAHALSRSRIHRVDASAAANGVVEWLRRLRPTIPPVYVHVDLDVLDPGEAQANSYAAPNGLRVAALVDTLQAISRTTPIAALAITAFDPAFDRDGRAARAAIAAAKAAIPVPDRAD